MPVPWQGWQLNGGSTVIVAARKKGQQLRGRSHAKKTEWQNISHILHRRNGHIYCLRMISATQKIPSYPELAKKQANEDGNLTSIRVCMF